MVIDCPNILGFRFVFLKIVSMMMVRMFVIALWLLSD